MISSPHSPGGHVEARSPIGAEMRVEARSPIGAEMRLRSTLSSQLESLHTLGRNTAGGLHTIADSRVEDIAREAFMLAMGSHSKEQRAAISDSDQHQTTMPVMLLISESVQAMRGALIDLTSRLEGSLSSQRHATEAGNAAVFTLNGRLAEAVTHSQLRESLRTLEQNVVGAAGGNSADYTSSMSQQLKEFKSDVDVLVATLGAETVRLTAAASDAVLREVNQQARDRDAKMIAALAAMQAESAVRFDRLEAAISGVLAASNATNSQVAALALSSQSAAARQDGSMTSMAGALASGLESLATAHDLSRAEVADLHAATSGQLEAVTESCHDIAAASATLSASQTVTSQVLRDIDAKVRSVSEDIRPLFAELKHQSSILESLASGSTGGALSQSPAMASAESSAASEQLQAAVRSSAAIAAELRRAAASLEEAAAAAAAGARTNVDTAVQSAVAQVIPQAVAAALAESSRQLEARIVAEAAESRAAASATATVVDALRMQCQDAAEAARLDSVKSLAAQRADHAEHLTVQKQAIEACVGADGALTASLTSALGALYAQSERVEAAFIGSEATNAVLASAVMRPAAAQAQHDKTVAAVTDFVQTEIAALEARLPAHVAAAVVPPVLSGVAAGIERSSAAQAAATEEALRSESKRSAQADAATASAIDTLRKAVENSAAATAGSLTPLQGSVREATSQGTSQVLASIEALTARLLDALPELTVQKQRAVVTSTAAEVSAVVREGLQAVAVASEKSAAANAAALEATEAAVMMRLQRADAARADSETRLSVALSEQFDRVHTSVTALLISLGLSAAPMPSFGGGSSTSTLVSALTDRISVEMASLHASLRHMSAAQHLHGGGGVAAASDERTAAALQEVRDAVAQVLELVETSAAGQAQVRAAAAAARAAGLSGDGPLNITPSSDAMMQGLAELRDTVASMASTQAHLAASVTLLREALPLHVPGSTSYTVMRDGAPLAMASSPLSARYVSSHALDESGSTVGLSSSAILGSRRGGGGSGVFQERAGGLLDRGDAVVSPLRQLVTPLTTPLFMPLLVAHAQSVSPSQSHLYAASTTTPTELLARRVVASTTASATFSSR